MFIGRTKELATLNAFKKRSIAGLGVIYGRRRIGKSTLIEQFAKGSRFLEFYGLSPRKASSNADQLQHFGKLMGDCFKVPPMKFDHWFHALSTLAGLTAEGEYIILLDEISWLGGYVKDFPGILKGIWDTHLKKNKQLILFLCGSVSSWIEENILNSTGFVGRVSLTLKLEEMPLVDANKFWMENHYVSAAEKFKLLCITGGVPRYLEEINIQQTAEENIKRLCYHSDGLLFQEFDTIFADVFGKRDTKYRAIVKALVHGALEQNELSEKLKISQTGAFSAQLEELESAGFIQRDFVKNINTGKTTFSKYRLRDNYLRFYLKYIAPKADLIKQNLYQAAHLENLSGWNTMMGLKFENLVLNNLKALVDKLNIAPESIISASPYFQKQTARQKAVQIDLLIQTQYAIYVFEIKFRLKINNTLIDEMIEKIKRLKLKPHLSVRPVLIYQGVLSTSVLSSHYFTHLISFEELLVDE